MLNCDTVNNTVSKINSYPSVGIEERKYTAFIPQKGNSLLNTMKSLLQPMKNTKMGPEKSSYMACGPRKCLFLSGWATKFLVNISIFPPPHPSRCLISGPLRLRSQHLALKTITSTVVLLCLCQKKVAISI